MVRQAAGPKRSDEISDGRAARLPAAVGVVSLRDASPGMQPALALLAEPPGLHPGWCAAPVADQPGGSRPPTVSY
jgi:hypothetical protein